MQAIVQGLLTNYTRSGKGKQVLVLPGWADKAANWHGFAAALAKHYDVVVLDLPGFGGSQTPTEAWSLDEYAAFVADFVAKVQLKPYAIIGHSNGGGIAIRGAANNVLRADKLVLLASAGVRGEQNGRQSALKLATRAGKLLAKPLPGRVQRRLRRKLYEHTGSDMLVAEHMQETFKKIVADDVRADARQLSLPTLLIYGEQDTATPVRYGQLLHQLIDDSTLEIVAGADHFLYLHNTDRVVELVEDFLK